MQHSRQWTELADKHGYFFRLTTESGLVIRETYIRIGEEYLFQSLNPLKRMVEGQRCTVIDFGGTGDRLMVTVQFEGSDTLAVVKAEELIRPDELRRTNPSERSRECLQGEFMRQVCPKCEGKAQTLEPIAGDVVEMVQGLIRIYAPKLLLAEVNRVGLGEEFQASLVMDEVVHKNLQCVELRGAFCEARAGRDYQVHTEAVRIQLSDNSLVGIWSQMALGCLTIARSIKDWVRAGTPS